MKRIFFNNGCRLPPIFERRWEGQIVREIRELSIGKNRSEQEDVLSKLSNLTSMVVQLRESLALDQAVNASSRVELHCRLTDIQLSHALSFISSRCHIDHTSAFRAAIAVRNRHRFPAKLNSACFWTSPKLQEWNASFATSAQGHIQTKARDTGLLHERH